MNVQQRLTKLEQAIVPVKDTREPMLVKFVGVDEQEPCDLAGLLYIYDGVPATEYRFNSQQLAEFEASKRNDTTEVWLNTVPRPAGAIA